jgi:hypothetical protein
MTTGPSTPADYNKYRTTLKKPTQAPTPKGALKTPNRSDYLAMRAGKVKLSQAPTPKGALTKPTAASYQAWRQTHGKHQPTQAPVPTKRS